MASAMLLSLNRRVLNISRSLGLFLMVSERLSLEFLCRSGYLLIAQCRLIVSVRARKEKGGAKFL